MSKALASLASIAVRNRELVWELTHREVMQPQANHFLGRYWLFMHPALSILVLFSVFYFIYPTRLESMNGRGFVVYLLSGLIPWVVISELMARACPLIRANANLVKQIVFPLETLVIKTVLASLFVQLVMSAVVFVILFITSTAVSPSFLPLWIAALVIQSVFMIGLTLILASITPFVPDTEDLVSLIARAGLFLAPVLYVPTMFSPSVWRLFYLNPFSYMVWIHRDALFYQTITSSTVWAVAIFMSGSLLVIGAWLFRLMSPSFGEAI
jgi:lipopolysaccharide transport system permease protein